VCMPANAFVASRQVKVAWRLVCMVAEQIFVKQQQTKYTRPDPISSANATEPFFIIDMHAPLSE
jgi:hypothetical protein